jgi:hypothetical protein
MDRPYMQNAIHIRTPLGKLTAGDDHISDDDVAPSRYYERQYDSYNPSITAPGTAAYHAYDDEDVSLCPKPLRRHHYRSTQINNINNVAGHIDPSHPAYPDYEAAAQMLRQEPPLTPPSTQEDATIRSRGTPPSDMRSQYRTPPPSPPRHPTPTLSSIPSPQFEDMRREYMRRSLQIFEDFDGFFRLIVEVCELHRERFRDALDEARGGEQNGENGEES